MNSKRVFDFLVSVTILYLLLTTFIFCPLFLYHHEYTAFSSTDKKTTMQVIDPRELNDLAEFAVRGGLGSTVASVIILFIYAP
jgi:hypothetical protein